MALPLPRAAQARPLAPPSESAPGTLTPKLAEADSDRAIELRHEQPVHRRRTRIPALADAEPLIPAKNAVLLLQDQFHTVQAASRSIVLHAGGGGGGFGGGGRVGLGFDDPEPQQSTALPDSYGSAYESFRQVPLRPPG